ncbi:glucose 1-dehydrogenase [Paenibacillus sp. CGMCC 1.16610]|uniref:Glucose 1-dehydrogenase n=1 Tax=Paenibacillus anseongense TaxID=2682845 RepID=A0ABW9U006_9BACL|nr:MULTISPECIES: glucose 1-dehydrogenase [Paenibacillus]MBA2937102.1 glucose 1-dehydrogenase [Paenibacillus sp. CGMCC 1.16610]MVQ33424.1 glucose 1-dehydrogenase [Paenibacillus anseongense]
MRLAGKVALITGAGAGIGKVTALRLAKEGAKVVATDINVDNVNQTAAEIQQSGGDAIAFRHDVSHEDNWKQVVEESIAKYGQIDILFNNAGIYFIKPLAETTVEEWNRMMSINVTSVFLGMKHVMPHMAVNKCGSVINASSIAGIKGAAGHIAYGASKGAVRTMTKDAAVEYAQANVRVNSIHPAYINTAMGTYAVDTAKVPEEQLAKIMAPLGRFGTVEEVANLVVFLASDESSFSTGAEFILDGGATAK